MSKIDKSLLSQSWQASVQVIENFLKTNQKLDWLLDRSTKGMEGDVSRRVQFLTFGVIRNLGRLQALLKAGVRKAPKKKLQAIMLVSLYEWLEAAEATKPLVVHHAVERAKQMLSKPESRFANAILRKMPQMVAGEETILDTPAELSRYYSHPEWMVERWIEYFGKDATTEFLKWNQSTPGVFAFSPVPKPDLPSDWNGTPWPNFYGIEGAGWQTIRAWLAEGKAYIQDPSTRLGAELLTGKKLTSVLDLCASPGGKSIQLLFRMEGAGGLLVSVDVPGSRFDRLVENLARYSRPGIEKIQMAADVLDLKGEQLPVVEYDAVFLDVPCSNSGVLQRRPDVKWRLTEKSIQELVVLQGALLRKAAEFVKPDGHLIYSTCSIEPEENRAVVNQFLTANDGNFTLEMECLSMPWQTGHDGAGVFLLRKVR